MNSKHTLEEKQNIITAYKSGKSVSLLVAETGIPRSTIYAWLADARTENSEKKTSFTLREYRSLENKVSRLEGIIDILQKRPALRPHRWKTGCTRSMVCMINTASICSAMRCACRGALFIIICCAANAAALGTTNAGRSFVRKFKQSMTTAARSTVPAKSPLF